MNTSPKRVLIIEDEKPLAHALELKLQHEGYKTVVAGNGQAGLDALADGTFHIVLLDLMMPVIDGFQVLETLKKKGSMPVIFVLSNLSQHEDEQRVLALGARKYFVKSDTPLSVIVEHVKAA